MTTTAARILRSASKLVLSSALALLGAANGCSDAVELPCSSTPIEIEGFATGFASCGGFRHRPSAESCPVFEAPPAPSACKADPDVEGSCTTNADCDETPLGTCSPSPQGDGTVCTCSYGCKADEDCEDSAICVCGQPFGSCVKAGCKSDADCNPGSVCAEAPVTVCDVGAVLEFACFLPGDECFEDGDCEDGAAHCVLGHDGLRTCQVPENCVVP